MLMHFLDATKFGALEEFQEEFADIAETDQVGGGERCRNQLLRAIFSGEYVHGCY